MNITLDIVKAHIRVNRHRLDEELELQGEFAYWIGHMVAQKDGQVDSFADEVKRTEARLSAEARERLDKPTEKEIEAWVRRQPERITAFEQLQVAKVDAGRWAAAAEGWKQRSYALKSLAALYSSDYWAQRTTTVTGASSSDESLRSMLREASESRSTPVGRTRVNVRD